LWFAERIVIAAFSKLADQIGQILANLNGIYENFKGDLFGEWVGVCCASVYFRTNMAESPSRNR
jgi:hypothetical protein